jgi:hypothetical protein
MRTLLPIVALLALARTAPAAAAPAEPAATKLPAFTLRAGEIFNLVYQLDCLPRGDDCAFQKLWKQQLGWTAADDQALERRREIRRRYSGWIRMDDQFDDAPLMLDAPRMLEMKKKLQLAAAGARDIPDYRARLDLVVSSTDAAELAAIVQRFLPRFREYFSSVRPRMTALTRELGPHFAKPEVRRVVAQTMTFYDVPAQQSRDVPVELIALPPDWTGPFSGEQVEHLAVIEFKTAPAVEAKDRRRGHTGSIVLHELFHYFYGSAPGEKARALAAAFASAQDPGAPAAYGLINEALATVFSVLSRKAYLTPAEFQTEMASGRPWYKDVAIDAAARAALPVVEGLLARGETLYDAGFVPAYLQALRAGMGASLDRPALKLRTLLVVAEDRELRPAIEAIQRAQAAGRSQTAIPLEEEDMKRLWLKHPDASGVVVVRGGSLAKLRGYEAVLGKGILEKLVSVRKQHRAFVQAVKRGRHSVMFVIVGDTPAEVGKLAEQLMASTGPFEVMGLASAPPS